jgi:lysophospholipid acyltransferase 1/2
MMLLVCVVADSQFFAMSWLSRVVYIIICTSMNRVKYYFAWKLGEFRSTAFGVTLRDLDNITVGNTGKVVL